MSEPLLATGIVSLYLAVGLVLAGLSIRVWHQADSTSLIARILFPWNARDHCVGFEGGLSLFGELVRHGIAPAPIYVTLIAIGWPLKLLWSVCTRIYVFCN